MSKRKTNVQLRVQSQAKVDEAGTSQFNRTAKSNVLENHNIIIEK